MWTNWARKCLVVLLVGGQKKRPIIAFRYPETGKPLDSRCNRVPFSTNLSFSPRPHAPIRTDEQQFCFTDVENGASAMVIDTTRVRRIETCPLPLNPYPRRPSDTPSFMFLYDRFHSVVSRILNDSKEEIPLIIVQNEGKSAESC